MTPGVPLVEVTRVDVRSGLERVESLHTGHLVVADDAGHVLAAVGDPRGSTYLRSTAKPFQATVCLELLAAHVPSRDRPTPEEIAVAWSSHRGEDRHLAAVRRLLARSGTEEDELSCPPAVAEARPGSPAQRIMRDCSGKHALFALTASRCGWAGTDLLDPTAPLQRHVLAGLETLLGPADAVAVDGCGAPAVALPLYRLAAAFAGLQSEQRFALVRDAGFAHPGLVGGAGRLETALLGAGSVAKVGAEGMFAAAWRAPSGTAFGVAAKAADGATRGANVAVAALLAGLGVVGEGAWPWPRPSGGGRPQGSLRPAPELAQLIAAVSEVVGSR